MTRDEAELRLTTLQSGRSSRGMRAATYLEDLQLSVERTAAWCEKYVSRQAARESLRPANIGPGTLPANRWDAVDRVAGYRDRLWPESLPKRPPGRLLIYFPDAELADGAAEVASEGFFDVHNAPPWGCWVGHFQDQTLEDSSDSSYLLAWVPAVLVPLAAAGIDVDPSESLVWLDDARVAVREIIPYVLKAS